MSTSQASATSSGTTETTPGPIFLAIILVGAVVIGSTYEPIAPVVYGILILIMVGLLLNGTGQIQALLGGQ